METTNHIRSLEYSFLAPKSETGSQLKMVQIKIDFEAAKFYFRGNWQYISGRDSLTHQSANSRNVHFHMNIFPSSPINLQDDTNDGLILFLKGSINGERQSTPSTGMVVFNRNIDNDEVRNSWNVLCYLYESEENYLEIKFKLPVFIKSSSLPAILGNIN